MKKNVILNFLYKLFLFSFLVSSLFTFSTEAKTQERDRSTIITPEDQEIIENFQKNLDPTKTYTKADCYFECRMKEESKDFCFESCNANPFWPFRN